MLCCTTQIMPHYYTNALPTILIPVRFLLGYSSKVTWHTWIEHMQLISWKHMVLSARIGVCRKENLPKLIFLKGKNTGYKGIKRVFTWVHTGSIQCLCTYICSYLDSAFSLPTLFNWLACIAKPRLDIDTRRVVFFKRAAGYSIHKLWIIGHRQTALNRY